MCYHERKQNNVCIVEKNQIADQLLKESTEHKQKESPRAVWSMEGDELVIPTPGFIWLPLTFCEATSFLFQYLFNMVNDNIIYWDLHYCINTLAVLQEKQKIQTECVSKQVFWNSLFLALGSFQSAVF